MEEDVVPVIEDEVSFDPQDLLEDPARQEISQTSLEIMQLLAECEGGREVFGNIHQGNFIYDNASLVGSSSELSDIFQDDSHLNVNSAHRLDDILVNSIDSLNKSPKKNNQNCQDDLNEKKKQRKSKSLNEKTSQKSSKSKISSSRSKKGSDGGTDENATRRRRTKSSKSPKSDDCELSNDVGNISDSSSTTSCPRFEKTSYKIEDDGTYTCKMCAKKFTTVKCLQIHSTVHRQKVKLVRKSKKDSEQHRSRRRSSTSTITNTPQSAKHMCSVYSGTTKPTASDSEQHRSGRSSNTSTIINTPQSTEHLHRVYSGTRKPAASGFVKLLDGMSPECDTRPTDPNRLNSCTEISHIGNLDSERTGNASCSKPLESLSRHGTREYMTLSSKKSKKSCRNETIGIQHGEDREMVVNSTTGKTSDSHLSKSQKKSVITTEQSNTRKRRASERHADRGEKYPMKKVCLLDRFQDDDDDRPGQNKSSDSTNLSTVDPNPKTNGGLLLQCFNVDKSPEHLERGSRTRVRIKRGQLVRTKTAEVHKLSRQKACESQQVFTGNILVGNTPHRKGVPTGHSLERETLTSIDSRGNSCVVSSSNKEVTQCNLLDDGHKITLTSQSTDTTSICNSALDSNSNLKSSQTISPKLEQMCKSRKLPDIDQMCDNFNNEGSGIDNAFQKNIHEKSSTNSEVLSQQGSSTMLQDRQRAESKGDLFNWKTKDYDIFTTVQNQIPETSRSIGDDCVDSKSDNQDETVLSISGTFSSNNEECCSMPVPSGQTVVESSENRQSSCESKRLMPLTDDSKEHCDGSGENESSDDESEPLVLYRQSCRTLPLCALLKLARRQKLVHESSRSVKDTVKENAVETQSSSSLTKCAHDQMSVVQCENVDLQVKCGDENDLLGNVTRLPQDIRDLSPSTMTQVTSHNGVDDTTAKISIKLIDTNLPNSNTVGIRNVSEHLIVDPQKSVSGSRSTTLPAEPPKCDKLSEPSGLLSQEHSAFQKHAAYSSPARVESNSPCEKPTLGLRPVEQQGASIEKHLGKESYFHGNCLPLESDAKQCSVLPTTEVQPHEVSVSDSVGMEGDEDVMLKQSKIRAGNDVQDCSKLSTSTDCTLSSLKSIADDNCIEVSISVLRRCSTSTESDDGAMIPEKTGEDVDDEVTVCRKNQVQGNFNESEDSIDDVLDNNCSDDDSVNVDTVQYLDDHTDYNQFSQIEKSVNLSRDSNIFFSRESKSGLKQIGVQQKLPKNLMSTCNVVGTFADDMVTGMTNVVDTDCGTETNSSNSSSVLFKFHDYCARQISYQNFLQWKLEECLYDERFQDSDVCARVLPYQAFHGTKCRDLSSSEKQLEEIPQVCETETEILKDSRNTQTEIERSHYNVEQAVLIQSDNKMAGNGEQTVITGSGVNINTVTRNVEQTVVTELCDRVTRNEKQLDTTGSDDIITKESDDTVTRNEDQTFVTELDRVTRNEEQLVITGSGDTCTVTRNGNQTLPTELDVSINQDVCVTSYDNDHESTERSPVGDETIVDLNGNGKIPSACFVNIGPTDPNQNVVTTSGSCCHNVNTQSRLQQTILNYGYSISEGLPDNRMDLGYSCSVAISSDNCESSEDDRDIHVNIDQVDTCARVQPFETNIMHKFSDKTKLLFQEYHDRNSRDISYSDSEGNSPKVNWVSIDNQTQTVSSVDENECSMYEIHMLDSVSSKSVYSNSTSNQNVFKMNLESDRTHSTFSDTMNEEGAMSTQSLRNTQESPSVNSRGVDDSNSGGSRGPGLTSKSDTVSFKSSMNVFNLEDISTSLLNQQNIPLTEEERRYLKSPKKLWYRNYMGGISTSEEKRGDNPKIFETPSPPKAFVFPELRDCEQRDDIEDELSTCLDSNVGKENAPETNVESNECSLSDECNRQLCEVVTRTGEESQTSDVNRQQSDDDYTSDATVRFEMCSRMRQFRRRRSCARACREGYLPGCSRSRVFVRNTHN